MRKKGQQNYGREVAPDEIIAAKNINADLIAMSTHGRSV
jgi:nucleotide-binding universal stress UspA family protein